MQCLFLLTHEWNIFNCLNENLLYIQNFIKLSSNENCSYRCIGIDITDYIHLGLIVKYRSFIIAKDKQLKSDYKVNKYCASINFKWMKNSQIRNKLVWFLLRAIRKNLFHAFLLGVRMTAFSLLLCPYVVTPLSTAPRMSHFVSKFSLLISTLVRLGLGLP